MTKIPTASGTEVPFLGAQGTPRPYARHPARTRDSSLMRNLKEVTLAGGSQDLVRLVEAYPQPCLLLDEDRSIRLVNRAFAQWLNLDPNATLGQRIENILILRGRGILEMWSHLKDGRLARASFNATYVSPGKVRTSQALAVSIGSQDALGGKGKRGYAVIFETLPASCA